ncbi:hypothetical protein M4D55_05105 [Metabacillus idriensis]|uniref:Uncharacterized protein n=1 Tax=Metabacillus idriensis TaxID=324768 RepID=A0A6I2M401_9BACI|nr:hypothetical protein [Metabacillus idriensis]MCM3595162.1 hypothetical protein [Metabacillus idriensis]MRX52810.1 hypothetical protein [Metabacillus idriensis]OHR74352.1 hypothetical protein HMPREF3291_18220 [Bacillus sp. HMSC76G11]
MELIHGVFELIGRVSELIGDFVPAEGPGGGAGQHRKAKGTALRRVIPLFIIKEKSRQEKQSFFLPASF